MQRHSLEQLLEWKLRPDRKPLILQGARQVGKTWILKELGRLHYTNVAYINFESNERMERLFTGNLDPSRLLAGLRIEARCSIDPGATLLIFDEIQACPPALTSLKYFAENAPEYHVAAAGSLLGVAMHRGVSFPVGKVEFVPLFPLSFMEFLEALGQADLAVAVSSSQWDLMTALREQLTEHLRTYLALGGMPEVVACYLASRDWAQVRRLQRALLQAYEQDFSKYAEPFLVLRLRALWNSIPAQLAREQKKFVYGLIKAGARAREFELAIQWLCDAGLTHKLMRASKPGMPLKAYHDPSAFKLFFVDCGLLAAHAGLELESLLKGNALFEEFKGALAEQYVSQELRLRQTWEVAYWSSDTSQAEVDFLLQASGQIFPVEVKAAENLQAKSLKVFHEKFQPPGCFRFSLSNYRQETWLTNVPLYALASLNRELTPASAPLAPSPNGLCELPRVP